MSDARHTPASGFDWPSAEDEDLTSRPGPDLRRLLRRVVEEARAPASSAPASEELARVLLGGEGSGG